MSISTGMTPVAPLQLSEGELRFYKEEGYLYIPGLIGREYIAALREEVLDVMAAAGATPERLRQASGTRDKLIQSGQYLAGSSLDALIHSPHLLSVAAQLMGGPSTMYLPFTAVKSGGGGGRFHFHQDNQYTRFDGPGINLWCALDPMTPENGCLQVVPRSHLEGTVEAVGSSDGDGHRMVAQEPSRFLPVRMNPGDCIAFSRITIHGSGPNETDQPRIAYAVQFHRDDVNALREGEWTSLKEFPRWNNPPLERLSRPDEKSRDGH